MDAVGAAVDQVVGDLLDGLGDLGGAVRLLLGLGAPAGHPTVPTISLPDLAADPMGAVRGYWRTLLTAHPEAITELLGVLRDVLGSAGAVGAAVTGTGTTADPGGCRSPTASGCRCTWWPPPGARRPRRHHPGRHPRPGLYVGRGHARGRARHPRPRRGPCQPADRPGRRPRAARHHGRPGARRARPRRRPAGADRVGIAVRWAPVGGLRFALDAPNLGLVADGTTVPLPLPALGEPLDDLAGRAADPARPARPARPVLAGRRGAAARLVGGTAARNPAARLRLADVVGPGRGPGRGASDLARRGRGRPRPRRAGVPVPASHRHRRHPRADRRDRHAGPPFALRSPPVPTPPSWSCGSPRRPRGARRRRPRPALVRVGDEP